MKRLAEVVRLICCLLRMALDRKFRERVREEWQQSQYSD